jgi:acyl-[acyl-carrier-protein]-phospholipid O-acyltransferase / long-chain-fatty-acid--[acyl-carrier-protein] ligase
MNLFALLARRHFLPLFVTQFLGAFTGNLFKNASIVLILYRLGENQAAGGKVLATSAAGLFVLPFFLFSATAGQFADRFDKARLIRLTKLLEIAASLLAAGALAVGAPWMLLAAIFLLGLQATLFGPLKYGILPDHLPSRSLLAANGLVEAGTFVAILAGTMLGSLTILAKGGITAVQAMLLAAAVGGWAASMAIPPAPPKASDLTIDPNIVRQTWLLLRQAAQVPLLLPAMMGVSWFWLVGATYLSQFPAYAKDLLHAGPTVVTLFLVMFTLGISIGSLICHRLLKGFVSLRLAPLGALGMALFGLDFVLAAAPLAPSGPLAEATDLLAQPKHWRLLADLLLVSISAGLYVVPLYAFLQQRADPAHRARVIAANNVLNALFMTVAAGVAALLLKAGLGIGDLFLGMAAGNLLVAGLSLRQAH